MNIKLIPAPGDVIAVNRKKGKNSSVQLERALVDYNRVFDQVGEVVFGRTEEIAAIKLAILVRQHVMLNGKHGIAKSKLAHEIFSRIVGAKLYRKMMMKNTSTDEVFGPMNASVYRKEARWEHNTEGFLPEADFAFIDETYRGNDSLLGAMMNILNEREFMNGPKLLKCPLNTAIGTTNFVSENPELEAFDDRWLIKAEVVPLGSVTERTRMLRSFIDREDNYDERDLNSVSLEQIQLIQSNLVDIDVPDEMLTLLDQLSRQAISNMAPKPYFSDRRLCQTLSLVVAQSLLSKESQVTPESLYAASYGLCLINNDAQIQAFSSAYETVIGDYKRYETERKELAETVSWVNDLIKSFSPEVSPKRVKIIRESAEDGLRTLTNTLNGKSLGDRTVAEGFNELRGRLNGFVEKIDKTFPPPKSKKKAFVDPLTTAAKKVQEAMSSSKQEVDGVEEDDWLQLVPQHF